jgi:hypothetical protein
MDRIQQSQEEKGHPGRGTCVNRGLEVRLRVISELGAMGRSQVSYYGKSQRLFRPSGKQG